MDKDLIKSIKVFDVYEGENIDKHKKSVALNITIQSTKKFNNGKIVSILEGGYDLNALAESANEHVNALLEFN